MRRFAALFAVLTVPYLIPSSSSEACTGITLRAQDGAIVYGRTLEWGAFDLRSRVVVVPRGVEWKGTTPDGQNGMEWSSRYGVVGIDVLEKDIIADGLNEQGLSLGVFYHPGFADYNTYDASQAQQSMSATDVPQYILTTCSTIVDVRKAMQDVRVVGVVEPALGFAAPIHLIVTEQGGKSIVIEWLEGEMVIFDNPLGVITNAPNYDWHMTNLRNYINLSAVALPGVKVDDIDFEPLGGGTGMMGLPGDFTPPSRFIRATAFAKTARTTANGPETVYELFRILDSFNVPLGAAEGSAAGLPTDGMRSSTIWTSGADLKNRVVYYHTQHNRRLRKIDMAVIDFARLSGEIRRQPLDRVHEQDVEELQLSR